MAAPGDDACHEIADCGAAPWGAIPVEPSTIYVDAAYAGGGSDGSAQRPFPTIAGGVAAAASGAIVAVAGGSYAESVILQKKVARWGPLPEAREHRVDRKWRRDHLWRTGRRGRRGAPSERRRQRRRHRCDVGIEGAR